ncbi:MAG: hypothetical protein Fur0036_03400 [Fimbriimonadaceae bacterium]
MLSSDARAFVGQFVELSYRDRKGDTSSVVAEVFDVNFLPLKGPCLITDVGDFRLDWITSVAVTQQARAA